MKRVIMVIGAGSAALAALARRTAETVGEIRDLASGGPSIEVCPECMRAYDPKPFCGCGRCQRKQVPCGLCDGVGIVDIGFGESDTCGGCEGTGRRNLQN